MKKNTLYEVLEVSENASDEVIEKAYKVLVKKYHPDLQTDSQKKYAEEKMKEINEAYDILGSPEKRKEYDEKMFKERELAREKEEQNIVKNNFEQVHTNTNNNANYNNKLNYERQRQEYEKRLKEEEYKQRKKMQENLNKEYENAYYNYLRSLGYKVKHKWTKENIKDFFVVIGIMAIIITILWFIPPSHDWMVEFYESNPIIKTIINIIGSIITGIFTGIWTFIKSLFGG